MSSSNDIRIILWMFLVIIKGAVVRGQTGGPNAVALIDGQAMLDCAVNTLQISSWTRTTDGTSDLLVIASACTVTGNISAHYRTELLAGDTICRLTIGSVTMQQAGVYTCFDGLSTTYRSLITVIDPVANVVVHNQSAEVVEGDQLNISCSINYNGPGYPAPSLHPLPYWTTSPEQIYTSATYNTSTNAVTLVANVIVQKSAVPVFQCNTVFSVTGNTSGYNATAPADNFTVGSTKELDVQYSPLISNISSEGRNDSTSSCEISTVTCHATANPTANYTWIDIDEPNKIIHNQSYACAEFGRNYNCSATNIIRTKPYTDVKMHEVRDEYSTRPPCKGCRMSTMNITGETCTDRICSCLLGCNMTVTCIADAYPEPTYEWMQNGLVIPNSLRTLDNALDGTYTCVAKNVIDGCEFEARIDVEVVNCSYCGFTKWFEDTTVEMTTTEPPGNETDVSGAGENNDDWMIIVGVMLVYEIANLISMGFFLPYYNIDADRNTNENNRNVATNKRALNNRFPWLERMLPCMNQSHASAGKKCLWIFVFSLITISCGVFIFPILIIIVKCCGTDLHGSQENSQLNLKLDDMSGSARGGNRFPPPPSSLPPAPRLPSTSAAGLQRPIPPPNKPTRPPPPAMTHQMNREGGAAEYAFLPLARRPHLAPAQYLDDDETSHYAILRRV